MVPKRELTFILPYLGTFSVDLRTRLRRNFKLKEFFKSMCRLNNLFRFKYLLEKKFALE